MVLEGALTEKSVRASIDAELNEAGWMAAEAAQSDPNNSEESDIARDIQKNKSAQIKIEKIKSEMADV